MKKRRTLPYAIGGLLLLGAGIAAVLPLTAQETTQAVPDRIAHAPTAIPDRIVTTLSGDPARTRSVTWRTDNTVAPGKAVAQIAPASPAPDLLAKSTTVPATTTPLTTNLGDAHYHSVTFTDLNPSSQYAYRVGDGTNWSEWFHFRTASDKAEPFTFIYFGDAQNEVKSLWSRAIRSAYSDAPKASLMIHAGDLINNAHNDGQWGEWHYAGGWVNGMIPNLPTPGNHEYAAVQEGGQRTLSLQWRPQFTLPTNGPAGLEETCYYVDYQGVRIISLNTEEKREEQVAWLDRTLANNPNRWTVLTFHRPMYSVARGRDNGELRNIWVPLFDKYRVDLVLQGHDHAYARSKNLRSGKNVRDNESGTVYVVSVSGPKMYNLEQAEWMQRAAEDTQLYQIVHIDGDTLRYEARTVTGDLYDAFELKKQRGSINRLINRIPRNVPERRRAPQPAAER